MSHPAHFCDTRLNNHCCKHITRNPDAQNPVLLQVAESMPTVKLLMASRTHMELRGKDGSEVDPFHYVPYLRDIFEEVELEPLAPEAGMQILRRGFRSTGTEHDDKAKALAEQCGLPLHLTLAAGVLSAGLAGCEVR